jgi:hypothetical protein
MACEQEMVDRKHRPKIPQIEVVNEIQILNKNDNQRSSANRSKSKSNKETNERRRNSCNKDKESTSKSKSNNNEGNNSKYKIKETDPDEIKLRNNRNNNDDDEMKKSLKKISISGTTPTNEKAGKQENHHMGICVCGKFLEGRDKKVGGKCQFWLFFSIFLIIWKLC